MSTRAQRRLFHGTTPPPVFAQARTVTGSNATSDAVLGPEAVENQQDWPSASRRASRMTDVWRTRCCQLPPLQPHSPVAKVTGDSPHSPIWPGLPKREARFAP